ncbi:hypothetical protein PINS_up018871 [Pythium insidiosum]|nr:hypothetical protein PINS_up018871 [Pythium insidiosum]
MMAHGLRLRLRRALRRSRKLLPLALDLLVLVALVCLDLRDLHYKVAWIGPDDSFSFYAVAARQFNVRPVAFRVPVRRSDVLHAGDDAISDAPTANATAIARTFQSGWPSLLVGCDAFYAAGSTTFIGGMGVNCTLGLDINSDRVPLFYMNARVRPDSMAWAACKLLYRHRRPTLCTDHIVTGFAARYGFEDRPPPSASMAAPFSAAETELLALLLVIAKSEPLTQITCIEGFVYDRQGGGGSTTFFASVFGCGAPNVLQRAFVGRHAQAFAALHRDKAWLTVDTIVIMGMRFVLRQNVRSEYTLRDDSTPSMTLPQRVRALSLTSRTIVNFSSSGVLYNGMVAVDVLLLLLNVWSAAEIARLMVAPAVRTRWRLTMSRLPAVATGSRLRCRALLASSLYRSPVVVRAHRRDAAHLVGHHSAQLDHLHVEHELARRQAAGVSLESAALGAAAHRSQRALGRRRARRGARCLRGDVAHVPAGQRGAARRRRRVLRAAASASSRSRRSSTIASASDCATASPSSAPRRSPTPTTRSSTL